MELSIENRNESYKGVVDRLPQKRKEVYELIKSNSNITIQEAAEKSGKPINEVSGRITELKNAFLVVETGSKTNRHSKKKNTAYRVVHSVEERIDLINAAFVLLREQREALEGDCHLGVSRLSLTLIQKEILKIKGRQRALEKILEQI